MDAQQPRDEELLKRALAGEEQAFTLLYRRRQAGIYRFAFQMSGSHPVAEDVTQEVFLTLVRDGARYNPGRASLAAYLYGIARNLVLRWLERQKPADIEAADAIRSSSDPAGELERDESIRAVRDAVLALPAHYREVAVLCDLHEISYEDAAAALGCAVGTVRSRLHSARGLLAEKLRLSGMGGAARGASAPLRSCV
jgi:RNA polymerase sigma-70 factor (ECF subfamily)